MLADIELISEQIDRPDEDIRAEVWTRLWHDDITRALERTAIDLEVHDNEVFLLGHVTNVAHQQHLAELAREVPGVNVVHNEIVADRTLVTEVAQALASDPRTRSYLIPVGAFHGWIHLNGEVPDLKARAMVETVAAGVSHARGILTLPYLPQEHGHQEENGRPLQPRLSEAVYAQDGPAGRVAQVVINPRNRLVSHIVVNANLEIDWRPIHGQWIVPVKALARVNESGVFLLDTLGVLAARPTFHEADFPIAPFEWQPPFPYAPGTVRWPSEGLS